MDDWRYAVRTLAKDPVFTVVAVVTLALGIAASTAVFSILNAVLLRDLPYPNSDRLVTFREYTPEPARVGPYHFSRWRSQDQIFAEVAALETIPADVTGPPNPERVSASRIAGDLFGILGVRPLLGRTFTSEEGQNQESPVAIISHFRAMGIGLLRGRTLIQDDVSGAPLVAVVSHSLEPYFEDGNALGKRVKIGFPGSSNPWLTVVGVVGDVRESNLTGETQPNIFVSYRQFAASRESPRELLVRSAAGDPMQLVPGIENEVWAIDKDQPISNIQTLDTALYFETAEQRFQSALLFLFSVLGLGLAAVGIYGVVSYFVAQRRQEIAIRIALGAQGRDTVRLVAGRSLALTAIGLALGTAGAFAVARVFASMLYGVSPTDPLSFAISCLALLLISITAAWVPTRRALTVEPLAVLRHE